jgi:hypothetical protein
MAARKKKTKTIHYRNYDSKKKEPTPTTYFTYDNTKKRIAIELFFIVNIISDCDNNSKVVKRR